ncbi:MAG: DISARM system helicase DrmA [Propionibacteriaceae bacterium]|jgi:hypothetical protein|nr:DISARM system helicase DrmA [Propionibacteriaceae bacterium]
MDVDSHEDFPRCPIARANQYEFRRGLDGSSWSVRENLADILARELLGPDGGDTESLDVPPDTKYVLGRIAPTKLRESNEAPAADDADDGSTLELGDDLAALESSGVPLSDVDDTAATGDEDSGGDRDDEPVRRGLMIPASMGLRFQVPRDLDRFTVRCSWGVYNSEKTGQVDESGRDVRRFRRRPVDESVVVTVADSQPGVTAEYRLTGDVVLRVDSYDDPEFDRWLIEAALCNDRETPRRIPTNAWMFQTQLWVEADGRDVFLPVRDVTLDTGWEPDDELRRLELQYRDRLEFAVGRTCSADWTVAPGARRATQVRTCWLPTAETPQTRAYEVDGASLDMRQLAGADATQLEAGLRPIVSAYAAWLDDRDVQAETLPDHLREEAAEAVAEARQVLAQLGDGLDFLVADEEARRCFGFMNQVMADQRVHSQIADLRTKEPKLTVDQAEAQVLDPTVNPFPHHWRAFQLAFVLMQLRALTEPTTGRRSGDLAKVELLFFPTGGGKTEAYLGLAAYAFAIRRRQGLVETPDGPLDGSAGVTVLMRYTLRLLTSQQFQRATTLVCAAELARQEAPDRWGAEPFQIGLWVGTNVSPKRVAEADEELTKLRERGAVASHRFTALQLGRCPWCGSPLSHKDVTIDKTVGRVFVRCPDPFGSCPFSEGGQVADGIPVLTTDEEIYRLAPCFVIATVDKFARLAREGEAASLFGYVRKRCDRHGFVHPDYKNCDIKDGSKHPAKAGHPAAAMRPISRLRPPDLIIQDELHLITGALGTTVGLFEVAIDVMTTWRTATGQPVKPVIVASSATVRNAPDQVRALYGRGVTVFPPQVIDVSDTFFSRDVAPSPSDPGRRYVGLSTTGVKLTTAEIQVAIALMAGAQSLLDQAGAAADPYMTLVGYFSATRELAGMARYVKDDVQTALSKGKSGSLLPTRSGTDFGSLNLGELTSRVASSEITKTLDEMAAVFDPAIDSTSARTAARAARAQGKDAPRHEVNPFDVVLATSMLQVGVDVARLGLMLVVGQPKNTAEYIQASSRVGRDSSRPGLVVTLGNWARPRDLAHYEQFRHYHETFYKQVEPLSVTPFSVTSLERGLEAVLVSAARVSQAAQVSGLSPEQEAGRVDVERPFMENLIDALVARVRRASDDASADSARLRLKTRLDDWERRRSHLDKRQLQLAYERVFDPSKFRALIRSAETVRSRDKANEAPFVVANSMREVQPEINLLVTPDPEKLFYEEPDGAPGWEVKDQAGEPA